MKFVIIMLLDMFYTYTSACMKHVALFLSNSLTTRYMRLCAEHCTHHDIPRTIGQAAWIHNAVREGGVVMHIRLDRRLQYHYCPLTLVTAQERLSLYHGLSSWMPHPLVDWNLDQQTGNGTQEPIPLHPSLGSH